MADLLEFLLNCVLEVIFGLWEWECLWRFLLPVLGALGLLLLIRSTISSSTVQVVLGTPVMIAGVVTGLLWQVRKG